MRVKRNLIFLIVAVVIVFGIFSFNKNIFSPKSSSPDVFVLSPTPAILSLSHVGEARLYPNPTITPGDFFVNINSSDVCKSGYSSSVRNVSVEEKRQVYQEYDLSYPQPVGDYEVDHFISLELGGSNDIKNLWPEPASPTPGFHEKDKVENYLHSQVCSGVITLQKAQEEIKSDWYKVLLTISK